MEVLFTEVTEPECPYPQRVCPWREIGGLFCFIDPAQSSGSTEAQEKIRQAS